MFNMSYLIHIWFLLCEFRAVDRIKYIKKELQMKIFFIIFISLVLISCSRGEIQTALCNATQDKSMIECIEIIEHEKRTNNNK